MNYVLKNPRSIIASTSPRVLVVTVLALHVIVLVSLAVPECGCVAVSYAISLGQLAWDQISTPSPPTPADDITLRVLRIWANHIAEVELPRLRLAAARIDSNGTDGSCRSSDSSLSAMRSAIGSHCDGELLPWNDKCFTSNVFSLSDGAPSRLVADSRAQSGRQIGFANPVAAHRRRNFFRAAVSPPNWMAVRRFEMREWRGRQDVP